LIPVINYCWFGGNPLPEIAQKCILSWRKYFPNYEIKEWNESNYDVHKIPFTDEAYSVKNFAFVSDYARLDIAYNYGGLYFDIDVEIIKSFDDINITEEFMAMESPGRVNSGLAFELKPKNWLLKAHLDYYESKHFINRDGSYNTIVCPIITTKILLRYGLKPEDVIQNINGITIYPTEYFCPKSFKTGIINITENAHTIHHFLSSWQSDEERKLIKQRWDLYAKYSDDELIMDFYNQYETLKNNDCNTMSLKKLSKIFFKRMLKKIKSKCLNILKINKKRNF
jgi:mannosyltransferase OCH1-like enzyme